MTTRRTRSLPEEFRDGVSEMTLHRVHCGVEAISDQTMDLAKIHLDEYKYRHELFWKLFQRTALAALTLDLIPFLYLDKLDQTSSATAKVRDLVMIFPVSGLIVAAVSWWLLRAEYERLGASYRVYHAIVSRKLDSLNLEHRTAMIHRHFRFRIGVVLPNAMLFAAILISAFEIYLLRGK
jgi:hypothetical protein